MKTRFWLLLLFCLASVDASAWTASSSIGIGSGDTLSLYSFTRKDFYDEDVGGGCAYYEYDPEWEEEYCAQWLMWENDASVWGVLWMPSGGAYAAGYREDRWLAWFEMGYFAPPETGDWTQTGDHWIVEQLYQDDGGYWTHIGTSTYYLGHTAVQITVPPPAGPCVPNLQWLLAYHQYGFDADQLWYGYANTVRDAGTAWRNFIWSYTSASAFTEATPYWPQANNATVRFVVWWAFSGTDTLGQTPDQGTIRLNPDIFQYSYEFARAIAMHEMGHARGYGHISDSCPITDSIMYPAANPSTYPALGPGDNAAAVRDIH